METEQARIVAHERYAAEYRVLRLDSPRIAVVAQPGQFVHLRVPRLDAALRRPFSIFDADSGQISLLYKPVGRGTRSMLNLGTGEALDLLGPLGNRFPEPPVDRQPVLVAGGYGVAPLYFLARRLQAAGTVMIGGACAADVLCADSYAELGWNVLTATEDGSLGRRGLVTETLDAWLEELDRQAEPAPEFYACGPDGMLRALAERAVRDGRRAWLSLDRHMGCGVGACLACVQRVRREDGGETWSRVCREGPVFEARRIIWETP